MNQSKDEKQFWDWYNQQPPGSIDPYKIWIAARELQEADETESLPADVEGISIAAIAHAEEGWGKRDDLEGNNLFGWDNAVSDFIDGLSSDTARQYWFAQFRSNPNIPEEKSFKHYQLLSDECIRIVELELKGVIANSRLVWNNNSKTDKGISDAAAEIINKLSAYALTQNTANDKKKDELLREMAYVLKLLDDMNIFSNFEQSKLTSAIRRYNSLTSSNTSTEEQIQGKEQTINQNVVETKEWIMFKNNKPEAGQEILIVWPSGTLSPEYRRLTKEDLSHDWDLMRWLPVPPYPSIQ